jgi:hypothetical protein
MVKNLIIAAIVCAIPFLAIISCNKTMNSQPENYESHHEGDNCMRCHKKGGHSVGRFTVAGTVYDSQQQVTIPNPVVKLYTAPNSGGTLVVTIYGDGKGNFYTTESIDFSVGLYVVVSGKDATSTSPMASSITDGACNSCHGSTTGKIFLN